LETVHDQLEDARLGQIQLDIGVPDGFVRGETPGLIFARGVSSRGGERILELLRTGLAERGFLSIQFAFPSQQVWRRAPNALQLLRRTYTRVVRRMLVHPRWRPGPLFAGGKGLGARVSTHIARDLRFVGLVLLSYPLHAPWRPQRMRHQHLYGIDTPMLMISGARDPAALPPLLRGVAERIGASCTLVILHGVNQQLRSHDELLRPQHMLDAEILERITDWMRERLEQRKGRHATPARGAS
jgi:hypothetical protein